MDSGRLLFLTVCFGLLAFLGLGYGVFCRFRARRLMERLDGMLDEALSGSFLEEHFDESLLSALELRMKQYLKAQEGKERRLRKEQEDIHVLISDLSHQLKTPAASLTLYSELLCEQELSGEANVCAEQLKNQSQRLTFLLNSLFNASRLEQGMIRLSPASYPVGEMLEELALEGETAARRRGIRIKWETDGEDRVFCDRKWTMEALWNLLDNAIKYTEEGDTVFLFGCRYAMFYRFYVVNHGQEIPEEERARIFGRFYRGKIAGEKEGTGLGLFLARKITEAQGGYMKAESSKEQTVFSIYLPEGYDS